MNFPGTNTITMNSKALMDLVQQALNESRTPRSAMIRVTAIKFASYGDSIEFSFTSDADQAKPATTTD